MSTVWAMFQTSVVEKNIVNETMYTSNIHGMWWGNFLMNVPVWLLLQIA